MSSPQFSSDVPSPPLVRSSEVEVGRDASSSTPTAEPEKITQPTTSQAIDTSSLPGESEHSSSYAGAGSRTVGNTSQVVPSDSFTSTPRHLHTELAPDNTEVETQSLPELTNTITIRASSPNQTPTATQLQGSAIGGDAPLNAPQPLPRKDVDTQQDTTLNPSKAIIEVPSLHARSAREEAFGAQRNRSSSRSSQKNVEKSIEATLVENEPAHHARSRKSSHLFGLFKEIGAGTERPLAQPRPSANGQADEHPQRGNTIYEEQGDSPNDDTETEAKSKHGSRPRSVSLQSDKKRTTLQVQTSAASRSSSSSDLQNSQPAPVLMGESVNEKSYKSISEKASQAPRPFQRKRLPSRLLEEIRHHHNVDTPFHHKFKKAQAKSDSQAGIEDESAPVSPRRKPANDERTSIIHDEHSTSEEEDEEEGSDKEQISSALYYPHQAPSPDALQDVNIGEARDEKEKEQQVCYSQWTILLLWVIDL